MYQYIATHVLYCDMIISTEYGIVVSMCKDFFTYRGREKTAGVAARASCGRRRGRR